jgi:hypothetical protein
VEQSVLPDDPSSRVTIAEFTYEEPFASLLVSQKGAMVDPRGRYSNRLDELQRLLTRLR